MSTTHPIEIAALLSKHLVTEEGVTIRHEYERRYPDKEGYLQIATLEVTTTGVISSMTNDQVEIFVESFDVCEEIRYEDILAINGEEVYGA